MTSPRGRSGGHSRTLRVFHRQVEELQQRIDVLRPDTRSAEIIETLETSLEELRVAVEELRTTDQALDESRGEVEAGRRRYQELFDLAPDAYLVTTLQGVIHEANRAASVILNIEPLFLLGKPLVVFLPRESQPAFRSEMVRIRELAGTGEYEFRLKPRRLPPIDASVHVGVVRDSWGQPTGLRWMIRDVSARKRAEEQIRSLNEKLEARVVERSEQLEDSLQANERWLIKAHAADTAARLEGQLFHDMVEEVDAILWRADAESGRYTFVSRRAEELLGYPTAQWLEDPDFWAEKIHPEDRDWATAHRRKQLRDGLDHEAEYRVVTAGGHALWFRESVRIVRREPDRPAVLCGLMVNITKRKKVERQLYTAKGELAMKLRDMTYLHTLGGRLATARGWHSTLDEILSAVTSLQGTDLALILIQSAQPGNPTVAASIGLPGEFLDQINREPSWLNTTGPVAIEDLELEPDHREFARLGGFRALASVPLFTQEGVHLGAIVTCFRTPYLAPRGQSLLVEMYAEHAAEALEAARLLVRLEEANHGQTQALAQTAAEMKTTLAALLDPLAPRELVEQQARQLLELVEGLDGDHAVS